MGFFLYRKRKIPILNYKCNDSNLLFWDNFLNQRSDFYISANTKIKSPDILVFMDSRGIGNDFNSSIINSLEKSFINLNLNYLIISRPVELTTWVTFYNTMEINNICPKLIITNMGFVDYTPKKKSIVNKYIYQIENINNDYRINFIEDFRDNRDKTLPLYNVVIGPSIDSKIKKKFNKKSTIIINTPIVNPNIKFERKRPPSFYKCIIEGNNYNQSFSNADIIEIGIFDGKNTYDGVHYTNSGNKIIIKKIRDFINERT